MNDTKNPYAGYRYPAEMARSTICSAPAVIGWLRPTIAPPVPGRLIPGSR